MILPIQSRIFPVSLINLFEIFCIFLPVVIIIAVGVPYINIPHALKTLRLYADMQHIINPKTLGTKVSLSDITRIKPANSRIAKNTFFIYIWFYCLLIKKLHEPHGWCSPKLLNIVLYNSYYTKGGWQVQTADFVTWSIKRALPLS